MQGPGLPRVVVVCGDPGGANAVAPVIETLGAQGRVAVRALAYRQASALWADRGISCTSLDEGITRDMVAGWLCNPTAGLLLTGTSANPDDMEKQFIAVARDCHVPSLAVLDFWANYVRRFSDDEGRLIYLPDRIAVMDEQAREEMIAVGFDPARLAVTGQPAFDDLAGWRSRFSPRQGQEIRDGLRVGPEEALVLFASQPISVLYGVDSDSPSHPGFTEQMVLDAVLAALEQVSREKGRAIVLAVRPHPREAADWFESVSSSTIRIAPATRAASRDLAMAADLLVGMNTILLVEACYLGCVVLSVQPGLRVPDVLPTNRAGLSRAVYRSAEIKPALEELLFDSAAREAVQVRLRRLRSESGAAQRVADLTYKMMGIEQGQ